MVCPITYGDHKKQVLRSLCHVYENILKLEMWANAQCDGRPAEYKLHPLFNAVVWLTPTTTE